MKIVVSFNFKILIFLLFIFSNLNYGQSIDVNYQELKFDTWSLKSGSQNSTGSIYLYEDILTSSVSTSNGGVQVDAIVTIISIDSGISITDFDNTSEGTKYFAPRIRSSNGSSDNGDGIVYKIDFIDANTFDASTNQGDPISLKNLRIHTYDIDVKQFNSFSYFTTARLSRSLTDIGRKIDASYDSANNLILFESITTSNDSSAPEASGGEDYAIQVDYNNVSSVRFEIGSNGYENVGGAAYYYIHFGPSTYTMNNVYTPSYFGGSPVPSLTNSAITASPNLLIANSTSTSTVVVQLKDSSNNNLTVSAGIVEIFTSAGSLSSVVDNNDGTYTSILTSSSSPEIATLSYTIDSNLASDTASVTFYFLDSTLPTFGSSSDNTFIYAENQSSGYAVGTVSATDNVGVSSYSIQSGNTNGYFAINASTGAITLTATGTSNPVASNDFETGLNTFTLVVEVSDAASNTTTGTVTINVTDVVEDRDGDGVIDTD